METNDLIPWNPYAELMKLVMTAEQEAVPRPPSNSRNGREGRFIGYWQGKAVRTKLNFLTTPEADSDFAWFVMSYRAGHELPACRPRYTAKADRKQEDA